MSEIGGIVVISRFLTIASMEDEGVEWMDRDTEIPRLLQIPSRAENNAPT